MMKKYGASYNNQDWRCRSCKHIFQGPKNKCPKCNSDSIEPIPDVMTDITKQVKG